MCSLYKRLDAALAIVLYLNYGTLTLNMQLYILETVFNNTPKNLKYLNHLLETSITFLE